MRSFSQALSASLLLGTLLLGANAMNPPKVKAYYPSYNADAQPPADINWAAYTDMFYFMVIPQANFSLAYDPSITWAQGEKLVTEFISQARKHNVVPHISTGGWTGSQKFSIYMRTDASRKKFAKVLVDFAKKHGFGGIEIDWEYPNADAIGCNTKDPADVVNFGLFAKEIRAMWPKVTLSAAVSIAGLIGSDGKLATTKETALLTQNLDYINLMAYDVYGSWAPTTGPLAPLYATCAPADFAQSGQTGVEVALKQGFKPSQVILGIPGYAKRSQLISPKLVPKKVNGQTSLYYQNITAVTPAGGKYDDMPGKDICGNMQKYGGSYLVTELISNGWLSKDLKTGLNGYMRHFDACSGQPFLTNGKYFITYDDMDSTVAKAAFAKKHNLGGIFFFDSMGATKEIVIAAGKAVRN